MLRVQSIAIGDAANVVGDNDLKRLAVDLRELASPIDRGEKIMVAIHRASRCCGLAPWRVFNIWYGKARQAEPREYEAVAAALNKKRREAARNELHELRTRLLRLESMLAQTDPDFHRDAIGWAHQQSRFNQGD